MRKLLERNVDSVLDRIVLVAPQASAVSPFFKNVMVDTDTRAHMIRDVQRMRGGVYLADGAIDRHQLTGDGCHATPEDEKGWHMLLLDEQRAKITACALYIEYPNTVPVHKLRVSHTATTQADSWSRRLWTGVKTELARARREKLTFVELGGWAVAQESRCTAGPLTLALAVYGFSRRASGSIGMTTATVRHCSSTILKRLGGSYFDVDGETLPPYFDQRYNCMMELLRFDSRKPNHKYIPLIDQLRARLADVRVLTRPDVAEAPELGLADLVRYRPYAAYGAPTAVPALAS